MAYFHLVLYRLLPYLNPFFKNKEPEYNETETDS